MFYLFWVPAAILMYVICGYFTKWANADDSSWKWVFALYGLNAIGLWPLIAKFSKNLLLDGLLYDLIIFFAFYFTLIYLKAADQFTMTQWAGTGVVVLGFIMIKLGAYW